MKKLIFFVFLLLNLTTQAQVYVDKVNINAESLAYFEVWEKYDENRGTYVAMVDYGQKDDRRNDKEGLRLRITNSKGAVIDFNSMIHILNYLHKQGWEVFHIKTMEKYESYLMRRITSESENFSRANKE